MSRKFRSKAERDNSIDWNHPYFDHLHAISAGPNKMDLQCPEQPLPLRQRQTGHPRRIFGHRRAAADLLNAKNGPVRPPGSGRSRNLSSNPHYARSPFGRTQSDVGKDDRRDHKARHALAGRPSGSMPLLTFAAPARAEKPSGRLQRPPRPLSLSLAFGCLCICKRWLVKLAATMGRIESRIGKAHR
jgi:hypothetical protein